MSFGDVGFLVTIFIFSEDQSDDAAGDCDIIIEVNLDKIKIRDVLI